MSVISDDRRRVVERHMLEADATSARTMVPFVPTSLEVVLNGRLEVQGGRYRAEGDQQVVFDPPFEAGDMLFLTYLPARPPQ